MPLIHEGSWRLAPGLAHKGNTAGHWIEMYSSCWGTLFPFSKYILIPVHVLSLPCSLLHEFISHYSLISPLFFLHCFIAWVFSPKYHLKKGRLFWVMVFSRSLPWATRYVWRSMNKEKIWTQGIQNLIHRTEYKQINIIHGSSFIFIIGVRTIFCVFREYNC